MGAGGISRRIIEFTNVLVGRVRGGLAQVNILASMFFGGISGSAIADVSSIGALLIPMMKDSGYDTDYAVDVTITSACQGLIIPPSHNMIILQCQLEACQWDSCFRRHASRRFAWDGVNDYQLCYCCQARIS